jgi:hypothetical protein
MPSLGVSSLDLGRLWQRRRPLFIYLAVAGAARLLPSPVIEPRDHQHVALVELVEDTAQLDAVGLRAARRFAKDLLGSGGAQLLHLRAEALAVGRYPCIAVNHATIMQRISAAENLYLFNGLILLHTPNLCQA